VRSIDTFAGLMALCLLSACQAKAPLLEAQPRECLRSAFLFGTRFELRLAGSDSDLLDVAADAAIAEGERLESVASVWVAESAVVRFNAAARVAGRHRVPVELARLVERAQAWCRSSGGGVDPTVGALLELYGYYDGDGVAPTAEDLTATLARVGCDAVRVDGDVIVTGIDGVRLDLGSMAKGEAVDRMASVLRAAGVEHGIISGGGSSVFAFGDEPGGRGWPLTIDTGDGVETWRLIDEAVGVSGQLSEPVFVDGRLVSHLIDPRSGRPVDHSTLQVVVRAQTATDADLGSTALAVMGSAAATAWLAAEDRCPQVLGACITDVAPGSPTERVVHRLRGG